MSDQNDSMLDNVRDPRIRLVRALRGDAAARQRHGAYVVEGSKFILEAVRSGAAVETVFIAPRLSTTPSGRRLQETLRRHGTPVVLVVDRLLDRVADTRTPQGAVAIVNRPGGDGSLPTPGAGRPLLVAWGVQDPGNLGALVRICDATGAIGMLVGGGGADPYHPRAVRAAAGAVERLRPISLSPPGREIETLIQAGYRLLAAVPRSGRRAADVDWGGPWALVVGSEGHGLPGSIVRAAAERVHVPMEGPANSLAVTASTAMLLYEAKRQRHTAETSAGPRSGE
ncbi:MAG: TrmH family RNA methyltransferase [Acidobacteriota bacterium]